MASVNGTDRPVYITENGCSCDEDRFRIVYIALYLCALKEAIDRGVDVRGYFYWSLMDNYEWGSFLPRFGMVAVNFENFERTPSRAPTSTAISSETTDSHPRSRALT
jgi:beta-glucosidase